MNEVLQLLLGPSGVVVLALFIVYSGHKKWWVFGWQHRETVEEKNEWKEIALRGTRIAESGAKIAEVITTQKIDGT